MAIDWVRLALRNGHSNARQMAVAFPVTWYFCLAPLASLSVAWRQKNKEAVFTQATL
jgi:hypothetical protein